MFRIHYCSTHSYRAERNDGLQRGEKSADVLLCSYFRLPQKLNKFANLYKPQGQNSANWFQADWEIRAAYVVVGVVIR